MSKRPTCRHRHAVQFYEDSASLCRTVAEFLGEGLNSGEPCVVIAKPEHEQQIVSNMRMRQFNVDHARQYGDLVLLNIEDTLGAFMLDGVPDGTLFDQHMSTIFTQVARVRPRATIRAYGEMVDVLWKAGQTDAAITLEMLWNSLASKHPFSLLCGYAMGQFYKQPDLYERVCAEHDMVLATDAPAVTARLG